MFSVAGDPDTDVRRHVCRALVMLLEARLEALLPHLSQIIQVAYLLDFLVLLPSLLVSLACLCLSLLMSKSICFIDVISAPISRI